MTKTLTQVIINLKGLTKIVTQERDAYGRFMAGGVVSAVVADGVCGVKVTDTNAVLSPLVAVQYSYSGGYQTSFSVNRTTGKGRAKTYVNDGGPMTDLNRLDFNAQI